MNRRGSRLLRQLVLLLLGVGAVAPRPGRAVPPDEVRALKPGASLIERAPFGEIAEASAVEVDDAGVVTAELLPAGEVLIEAREPGVAHVFLFGRRTVRVLQVAVAGRARAVAGRDLAAARDQAVARDHAGAAGSSSTQAPSRAPESPGSPARPRPADLDPEAALAVVDEASFLALAAGAAEPPPGEVAMPRYRFELAGLQAEAKAAQALLVKAGLPWVRASFSPFGVKLAGARDEAERRRAVVVIYPAVLGRLRLAD